MKALKIAKLAIFLIVSLIVMIPLWFSFLDHSKVACSIEEFNEGKYHFNSHLTITGNALFNYAYRYEELSGDTLYNVSYYVPLVDSVWTIDKPIKTILQFESGKMAFDDGFLDAVKKLENEIDSFSRLKSNRITFTGNNKLLEFSKIEGEAENYFKNVQRLNILSDYKISKIVVHEHFSMFGFIFMTIFTLVIGFLLYNFSKPVFKRTRQNIANL